MITVNCPKCGADNEVDYEAGDESCVCDGCDAILLIYEHEGEISVGVV